MLTAGAIVLAVVAPIVDTADKPSEAATPPPMTAPVAAPVPVLDPIATLSARSSRIERTTRVSRAAKRGYRVASRPAIRPVRVVKRVKVVRKVERAERPAPRRVVKKVTSRKAVVAGRISPGMGAVIAFARANVGKSYRSGGEGPHAFDCSGFTKTAYALAGLRLPHSSGGQASRARRIPRSQALPGDLVVGPGHVGIYMGNNMMIDAGNRRTGVVYRKLYAGLRVARL